ncbi:hypothetical protein LX15_000769 [Streptoalloteichus tenebrarius]|uniref:Uncharacterized protein n=2 Tax=Streptoalloteichus tenebrarius (strain ATCC 17920 / DSM 40477 / JCM 4838 / CBS 697.72 / NBRC 16177 / NCIMB 11028 / NRRL B-12390 / A12253. 1 / ISP 5477) TaxID=1933 RepID=A0ABT1HNK1_STRSD|nr:hypothetical protein [Streptoalloteichus tenebrarius]BFE98716.1 hypothetical protein GCM10020241_03920 [Streptoalloteichus tenebrarius]
MDEQWCLGDVVRELRDRRAQLGDDVPVVMTWEPYLGLAVVGVTVAEDQTVWLGASAEAEPMRLGALVDRLLDLEREEGRRPDAQVAVVVVEGDHQGRTACVVGVDQEDGPDGRPRLVVRVAARPASHSR